ncbi:ribbon-helix-helix domain-containing protein [Candidatus Lokiarchaeum ossiferum]|uniref:ribbon-helix-helix domain-containing protein n=1 Tax=Candidatus Lokiarchaeum ossiferum TaxID=2951803 RepID=UPI00352D581B
MVRGTYVTLKLPEELVKEYIDSLLDIPKYGFSSRAEIVKNAVREYFEKLEKKNSTS